MRRVIVPIAALLLSEALLILGHGMLLTLVPLRAQLSGFSAAAIGVIGSAYFIGFVAGCLATPLIVRRVGHIRAFAVLATLFSAFVLLLDILPGVWWWVLLRFIVGACISGLYMIMESWLNERANPENRGTVLSIYTVINLTMIMLGQQLLNLADPSANTLFALAAILVSLAIVPVSLTLMLAPAPIHSVRIDMKKIWAISHVGVWGAVVSGLVTGAFWSLAPLYARGVGLDTFQLTLLMSITVLGGACLQLPLGRLSDHYDRRLVVFYSSLAGVVVSLLLALFSSAQLGTAGFALLAFLWGGSVMTIYAISLAHASDNASGDEFVMLGSGMLLTLGASSAIGAPLCSALMQWFGPSMLYVFSALCLLLFAVVISVRRRQHVLPEEEASEPFRVATYTSPAAFEMDPRTEEPAEDDDATVAAGADSPGAAGVNSEQHP